MSWLNTFEKVAKYIAKYSGACDDLRKLGFDAYIHVAKGGAPTLVVKKVLYSCNATGVSDPK